MDLNALLDSLYHPDLKAIDISLDRITGFLAAIDNPERKLPPVIHVAGTNGKGSLTAYLQAILQAAGLKVHRYTSPHLVRFNERITVAGKDIDDARLFELLTFIKKKTETLPLTFFEATTVAAFIAFAETPADAVVLEVGLGGRLDATNVIMQPALTAITPVSFDHKEFLGETLGAIAAEKAGILKPHIPCVTGPQPAEALRAIETKAKEVQAPLYRYDDEWQIKNEPNGFTYRSLKREIALPLPNLPGIHQVYNAATAIACMERSPFAISDTALRAGITHAHWPARLQRLRQGPLVDMLPPDCELWLDGGHNAAAGEVLAEWIMSHPLKPVCLIAGMLRRKEAAAFFVPMARHAERVYTVPIPDEPHGKTAEDLAVDARTAGMEAMPVAKVADALQTIINSTKPPFTVLICGSLYLAGTVLAENN